MTPSTKQDGTGIKPGMAAGKHLQVKGMEEGYDPHHKG
jgi:hypothetical protein